MILVTYEKYFCCFSCSTCYSIPVVRGFDKKVVKYEKLRKYFLCCTRYGTKTSNFTSSLIYYMTNIHDVHYFQKETRKKNKVVKRNCFFRRGNYKYNIVYTD